MSCCVFSVGSERSYGGCGMRKSGDESAYMVERTRALEDLVVRERTDDKRAATNGLSVTSWRMARLLTGLWTPCPCLLPLG